VERRGGLESSSRVRIMALLKFLLANVSAATGQQQVSQSSTSLIFPPGVASRTYIPDPCPRTLIIILYLISP
jgi:hypothetical protein